MTKEDFMKENRDELNKPVTLGVLLEFASDFLIPAMSDMVDERVKAANAAQENNLKTYIDRKLSDYTTDIFKRLEKESQKDKDYKQKVIEILKKNKIGTGEDIAFLQGFVNAL